LARSVDDGDAKLVSLALERAPKSRRRLPDLPILDGKQARLRLKNAARRRSVKVKTNERRQMGRRKGAARRRLFYLSASARKKSRIICLRQLNFTKTLPKVKRLFRSARFFNEFFCKYKRYFGKGKARFRYFYRRFAQVSPSVFRVDGDKKRLLAVETIEGKKRPFASNR